MKMNETLYEAVKSYKNGNEDVFSIIYEESYRYLYTCVWNVVKNEELAQDMLQETYMEIVKNIQQLRDESTFPYWAATIANRKCYAYIKKNQECLVEVTEDEDGNTSDFFENIADDEELIPENIFDNQEKMNIIRNLIDELSDIQRACVIGVYYNEMKQEQVADELGIPVNTVKSHLNRAKAKLKAAVQDTEKQQGIKLYSFAPFILLFFTKQAEQLVVAPMSEMLKSTAMKSTAEKVVNETANKAVDSTVHNTANNTVKKVAFDAGKMKLAGMIGASVAVVGILGVGIWGLQNQKTKVEPVVELVMVQEAVADAENTSSSVDTGFDMTNVQEEIDDGGVIDSPVNDVADTSEPTNEEDTIPEIVELNEESYFVVPEKYEAFGNVFGGIIPVKENGLWGAIDYSGTEIVSCSYEKLCRSANDRGYFILGDGENRVLFDSKGNIIYSGADLDFASGTMYVLGSADEYGMEIPKKQYYTYDGTLVLEAEATDGCNIAGSFVDGYATVYRNQYYDDNRVVEEIGQLSLDGEISWSTLYDGVSWWEEPSIQSDWVNGTGASFHQCLAPDSSINKGYYLAVNWPQEAIIQLRNSQNELCSGREYLSLWNIAGNGEDVSFDAEDFNEDKYFKSYFLDGGYLYNYGSLVNFVEGEKNYLIDMNGTPRCLGAYDILNMSEEKLWGIGKDGMWGYIDHEGNIQGLFEDASAFSNGLAFIVEDGHTYVVNDRLERLSEFGPADRVGRVGDALCMEIDGERRLYFTK